jgi:hypothetical protein
MVAGKEALGQTPNSGIRGRPRKRETSGSTAKKESMSSSTGLGSTPGSRTDSNIPIGYVPAETSSMMTDSPTPASHSALRHQRRFAQFSSPGDQGDAEFGVSGTSSANPYDPNAPALDLQSSPPFNPNPGLGARRSTRMGPPTPSPARPAKKEAKNTTNIRGKKRSKRNPEDGDYEPSAPKKSHR